LTKTPYKYRIPIHSSLKGGRLDQYHSVFDSIPQTNKTTKISFTLTNLQTGEVKNQHSNIDEPSTHPKGIVFYKNDSVWIDPFTESTIVTISGGNNLKLPVNSMMAYRKLSLLKEIIISKKGQEILKYSNFKVN
jgi:hypothetical protein